MYTLLRSFIGPIMQRHLPPLLVAIALPFSVASASADTMSFSGQITQSTQNGTGPAVNNPSLNNILDGDSFTLDLTFSDSITSPGTYALTSATVTLSDPSAMAAETSFGQLFCAGQMTLACLTVTPDGSDDDISLLACLTTGSGCFAGNQLALTVKISAAALNSQNAAVQPIVGITPLDLLEDDGVTDMQGLVTKYSYGGVSSVPEPYALLLLSTVAACIFRQSRQSRN